MSNNGRTAFHRGSVYDDGPFRNDIAWPEEMDEDDDADAMSDVLFDDDEEEEEEDDSSEEHRQSFGNPVVNTGPALVQIPLSDSDDSSDANDGFEPVARETGSANLSRVDRDVPRSRPGLRVEGPANGNRSGAQIPRDQLVDVEFGSEPARNSGPNNVIDLTADGDDNNNGWMPPRSRFGVARRQPATSRAGSGGMSGRRNNAGPPTVIDLTGDSSSDREDGRASGTTSGRALSQFLRVFGNSGYSVAANHGGLVVPDAPSGPSRGSSTRLHSGPRPHHHNHSHRHHHRENSRRSGSLAAAPAPRTAASAASGPASRRPNAAGFHPGGAGLTLHPPLPPLPSPRLNLNTVFNWTANNGRNSSMGNSASSANRIGGGSNHNAANATPSRASNSNAPANAPAAPNNSPQRNRVGFAGINNGLVDLFDEVDDDDEFGGAGHDEGLLPGLFGDGWHRQNSPFTRLNDATRRSRAAQINNGGNGNGFRHTNFDLFSLMNRQAANGGNNNLANPLADTPLDLNYHLNAFNGLPRMDLDLEDDIGRNFPIAVAAAINGGRAPAGARVEVLPGPNELGGFDIAMALNLNGFGGIGGGGVGGPANANGNKPPHVPPEPAREGFTRNTGEEVRVICPSCSEELKYDPDAEAEEEARLKREAAVKAEKVRTSGKSTPLNSSPPPAAGSKAVGSAKKRTRQSTPSGSPHHFWAIKACGHVYCRRCFENRRPAAKEFANTAFRQVAGSTRVHPKVLCAVRECDADVSRKESWIGLFV